MGRPVEPGNAVAWPSAEPELLCVYGNTQGKRLGLFGRTGASGKPEAFHLYSMRQAIEEEFILDVVKNYTTYKTYYRLVKAVEDDPSLPKKKAARALGEFMSLHEYNIEQRIEVIVEHFRQKVRSHVGGLAKASALARTSLTRIVFSSSRSGRKRLETRR